MFEFGNESWGEVLRIATLIDYSNVGLYVIANDAKKIKQVLPHSMIFLTATNL